MQVYKGNAPRSNNPCRHRRTLVLGLHGLQIPNFLRTFEINRINIFVLYVTEDAKLSLYWQNHYSPYDKPSSQTELVTRFGNSLVRLASEEFERNTQQCVFMDLKLVETHVLFEADKFQRYNHFYFL